MIKNSTKKIIKEKRELARAEELRENLIKRKRNK
jgi:hypothetical protein|tara:strand:- start:601 stop:702 length:102 start_codon:yes stop_codon:yes gene_type:complete